jgi:predicted flap endonuclease-1-like 5' DNA nuclease
MSHLILELILWMLLAFFIGCIIGCILRKLFAKQEMPVSPARDASPAWPEPIAKVVEPEAKAVEAEPEAAALAATGKPSRPKGIAAARESAPDNLQRISGIGPKNEKTLHGLGFFHFDQIAAWTPDEIQWVDEHLKFNGRIIREKWVHQATLLAEGKEEEFRSLYGSGGVKDTNGSPK